MTKLLSRNTILKKDLFTVYEDHIELPTGSKRIYHNVQRAPAVSIFPITEENEVYLIKQYRYLHEKYLVEGVAGIIDEGESAIDAAKRELKEETGISAENLTQIATMHAAGSIVTWEQPIFVAQGLTLGDAQMEESEDISLIKIPVSEAVELVINGEVNTGASVAGILMLEKWLERGKL